MPRNNLEEVFLPTEMLDKSQGASFRWVTFHVGQTSSLLSKEKFCLLPSLTLTSIIEVVTRFPTIRSEGNESKSVTIRLLITLNVNTIEPPSST